jgi:hypothetical protein
LSETIDLINTAPSLQHDAVRIGKSGGGIALASKKFVEAQSLLASLRLA